MIDAEALAGPAILVLFAAIPVCCVLTAIGRRGALASVLLFAFLALANTFIAFGVREYGELGIALIVFATLVLSVLLLISWHIGSFIRERRTSPGKRHVLVGE